MAGEEGLLSGAAGGFISALRDAEDRKYKKMAFDAQQKVSDEDREFKKLSLALEARKSGINMPGFEEQLGEADPSLQYQERDEKLIGSLGQRPVRDAKGKILKMEPVEGYKKPVDPNKAGDRQDKFADTIRQQWMNNPTTKDTQTIASAYEKVASAANNPSAAGDLSLIFGYMKLLDPGSTVREGEFANAQNAAGIPDQVRNAYNKAQSGTRLNPKQRQDFANQAKNIFQAQMKQQQRVNQQFSNLAKRRGLPAEDVVMEDLFDQSLLGALPDKSPGPKLSPEDQQAQEWATQNPKDPRSQQILQNLKSKYGI